MYFLKAGPYSGRMGRMVISVTSALLGSFRAAMVMQATSSGRMRLPGGAVLPSAARIADWFGVSVLPG